MAKETKPTPLLLAVFDIASHWVTIKAFLTGAISEKAASRVEEVVEYGSELMKSVDLGASNIR